ITRDDSFLKEAPLTGQFLQIPGVIPHQAVPEKYKSLLLSFEQNKNAPILNRENLDKFLELYSLIPEDPRFSPLLLSSHKDPPPVTKCVLLPLFSYGLFSFHNDT
ncbi:hypothetical protein L218DRAFT_888037, partial [Marasmius fiardii PR-910]